MVGRRPPIGESNDVALGPVARPRTWRRAWPRSTFRGRGATPGARSGGGASVRSTERGRGVTPEEFRIIGHRLVDWIADYRATVAEPTERADVEALWALMRAAAERAWGAAPAPRP